MGLPWWLSSKESAWNEGDAGDVGSSPRWEKSPGGMQGHLLQYSCLENPMDRGAWWASIHRITKSWKRLKWLSMHTCMYRYKTEREIAFFFFCFHTLIFLLLYPLFHWDIFLLQRKHDSQSPKLYAVALSLQFHSTVIHWETSDHFLTGCSLACPPVLFLVEILSSKDLWIFPSKHLSANSSFICRKLMLFLLRNALKHWP